MPMTLMTLSSCITVQLIKSTNIGFSFQFPVLLNWPYSIRFSTGYGCYMARCRFIRFISRSTQLLTTLACLIVCSRSYSRILITLVTRQFIYLRQRRRYMFSAVRPSPFVYVCLCARLLKNACMDLDEMLRVDRCRDMDELINFWARSGSYPDAGAGFTPDFF